MLSILGLDIETSKNPNSFPWCPGYYLSIISVNYPNDTSKTWYFKHNNVTDYDSWKNFNEIQAEIDKYDAVACHNAKFELNNLRSVLKFKDIHCTMVGEYILNYHEKNINLDKISERYGLPVKDDRVKTMWNAGMDTHEIPISILQPYCEDDARKARIIAEDQVNRLQLTGMWKVFKLQMEWLDMLSAMECSGILWDNTKAHDIINKYRKYSRIIESKIKTICKPYIGDHELNLSSNDDLSILLYGGVLSRKEKIPTIKTKNIKTRMPYVFTYKNGTKKIKQRWIDHPDTRIIRMVYGTVHYKLQGLQLQPPKKGEVAKSTKDKPFYKVDKDTLLFIKTQTHIQNTITKLLLKKSSIEKVISTFIGDRGTGLITKIGTDGCIHTNYNQAITATGRLSSSDPNNQNLPRRGTSPIKQCIIPRFWKILNADLSQIELRVPAQLSQDPVMMKEFLNKEDLHANAVTKNMKLVLNKQNRYYAKRFNFRMIYGGTEYGFHKDPTMPNFGLKKWREIVRSFYARYRGLETWQNGNIQHVINGNGSLVLPTGRTYKFNLQESNGKYNERQIKNYPVQGIAGGDILPLCAVIIWKAMKKSNMKSIPILTVHDSLVFDVFKGEENRLADLCMKVFNNLPVYIENYFNFKWQVPITGEVEIGNNYGDTKKIRP